ncbi:MAG: hypothetical protein ACK451_01560 [Pseudanabaena sp.]
MKYSLVFPATDLGLTHWVDVVGGAAPPPPHHIYLNPKKFVRFA